MTNPPPDLTDAELDDAVAQHCLGWTLHTDWKSTNCCPKSTGVMRSDHWSFEGKPTRYRGASWAPTRDARDAEQVWDWLSQHLPEGCRMIMTGYDDSSGGFCVERYDEARKIWGSLFPELDADWAHPGEAIGAWKRGLCLAALAIARGSKI